jgi:hypothetical protein
MSLHPDSAGFLGARDAQSANTDLDAHLFLIRQVLATVAGSALVLVRAVTNTGGLAAVGYVDVQPMVNQIDGAGNATPHGTIHHLPYFRLQGGANAIILDPQVGDIGIAVFADRDISSVKATKKVANPGSRRRNSMSDGIYIGGVLNGVPSQYITFTSAGIAMVSPTAVLIQAPVIGLNGSVAATGTLTSNGHDISSTHHHSGVQTGSGNSGVPL